MSYFWKYEEELLMELRGPFSSLRLLISDVVDLMPLPDHVSSINADQKVRVMVFKGECCCYPPLGFVSDKGIVTLLSDVQARICYAALERSDRVYLKTLEIGVSRVFAGD